MWSEIDNGCTIGTEGSEKGIIIKDEEHKEGARITLEKEAQGIPFAITCGIYGLMVHTAFASSEEEAMDKYDEMKRRIQAFIDKDTTEKRDSDWCDWFADKF